MYLTVAICFLVLLFVNVVVGSLSGTAIVGDIPEVLILSTSAIAFVVEILRRESASE